MRFVTTTTTKTKALGKASSTKLKFLLITAVASLFALHIFVLRTMMSPVEITQYFNSSVSSMPPSAMLAPKIYKNISEIPQMISTGPKNVLPNIIGLYEFENVCLMKHATEYSLTGLVYFTPQDTNLLYNPKRCIPCSAPLNHNFGWHGVGRDEHEVNHKCGFEALHAMFATDVSDFAECYSQDSTQEQLNVWGQRYIPPDAVNAVHYYEEPMIHLTFSDNIGHAFFDHLLTYLPYWHSFRRNGSHFPFKWVTSLSYPGCLSSSRRWYCEVLRAMDAFGGAIEVYPPSISKDDHNTTLYCYKKVHVNHLALQRTLRYDEQIPKLIMDEFRDMLFARFSLERERAFHNNNNNDSNEGKPKRILLYAHEASGRRVFLGMNDLISEIRPKYPNVEFSVVGDFGAYSVVEQANLFNTNDAMVMVHGAQMANSIFAVDKSLFVELGCAIPTFIGNEMFMRLLDGRHIQVEECEDGRYDEICVVCNTTDSVYGNFTMTSKGFQTLIDTVLNEM